MLEPLILAHRLIRGLHWCLKLLIRSFYFFFAARGLQLVALAFAFTMRPPFTYLYPGLSIHTLPAGFFLVAIVLVRKNGCHPIQRLVCGL